MIKYPVNLNELLPFCCSFDRLIFKCYLPYPYYIAMNRAKGGRHNYFLDKWLKEFG